MEGLAAQTHRFLENVTQEVFCQQILSYWFIGVELKVNLGNHRCVVLCIFITDLHLCKSYSGHRQGAPFTQKFPECSFPVSHVPSFLR